MPLHLCRGESSRALRGSGLGLDAGKVEEQGKTKNCFAQKIILVTARNKNCPLGSHPQLWSHSHGEGGCCAVGWARREKWEHSV